VDIINDIIVDMKWKALVLILVLTFLIATPVSAAKKRVWSKVATTSSSSSGKFSIGAKLTGWKQYLDVSFKGMSSISGATYELVYNSNGTEQGVYGTVKPSDGNVVVRSIFLGTCSHGACVSHKNVSNVHLTITYKTTSGQEIVKKYKVKY